MPGLGSIRLAPTPTAPYKLACFFPEAKGKPASVRVVQYPQMGVPLAAKSFYKCVDELCMCICMCGPRFYGLLPTHENTHLRIHLCVTVSSALLYIWPTYTIHTHHQTPTGRRRRTCGGRPTGRRC